MRGPDAARAWQRGARCGGDLIALDQSGWELVVSIDEARADLCSGAVTGRHLASEPRTKVAMYHGLLHPSDFRRLIAQGTALGIVAFVPVISDRSVVPRFGPDGALDGSGDWPTLARDAAELHGRGRRPSIATVLLFDQALDRVRASGAALLLHPGGAALAEALRDRPFSIDVICPPPAGFSAQEVAHAAARGVTVVDLPRTGPDPIQAALTVARQIYESMEA